MSSVKKRKGVDERRVFQNKWTEMFFFYQGKRKTVLLKVQKDASSYEKTKI